MTTAAVNLWGTRIAAVTWVEERDLGFFEYDPEFLSSGIEVAPLVMPLSDKVYSFPQLARGTFFGLPGMLADVLPDKFGNAVIDAWLASRGRTSASFDPVQRLCYTGTRGMGALEFEPAIGGKAQKSHPLDVAGMVELASLVLTDRRTFETRIAREDSADHSAVRDILRVGTSAGGARAKAVVAWNRSTGEVRSGQVDADSGFTHWILKFDGVTGNRDKELEDPGGYCRIEYAYHLMALEAGIEMTECRLLEEGGRAHFMTRRFDRTDDGRKLHMQSLCALGHLDFNLAGAHSYEQALMIMRHLELPVASLEQQLRRTIFNVIGRNQDDHTKNIAFLMDKSGAWSLTPAFDVTWAYNPSGAWTSRHQMTVNGKRDEIAIEDLAALARSASLRRNAAAAIAEEVGAVVRRWPEFAARAGVPEERAAAIAATHRRLA